MKQKLISGADMLGISLDESKADKLTRYAELLAEWNEKINLTAITAPDEIVTKHFLDSLSIFKTGVVMPGDTVIDVGTGAGFPGLVMKIAVPSLKITLLDSLEKRLDFLRCVCDELNLSDVIFVHARAEDAGKDKNYREKYDIATARAVANMSTLAEYLLPFVKIGGRCIALKGPLADEELENAGKAVNILGGKIEKTINAEIPFTELKHKIVCVKKARPCPKMYPRKAGTPAKKPI